MASILDFSQRKVFLSFADTIIAALDDFEIGKLCEAIAPSRNKDARRHFAQEKFSDNPKNLAMFESILASMPTFRQSTIMDMLNFLNSFAGRLLVTGGLTPFEQLSRRQRESVILDCFGSRIPTLRAIVKVLSLSISIAYWRVSLAARQLIGDLNHSLPALDEKSDDLRGEIKYLSLAPKYQFVEPQNISTDVLIIGSGSGGSVAAATLAQSGRKVLVVEKGGYYNQSKFPLNSTEAHANLFESGASISTEDGNIFLLAGSTFGGGSTVNWSVSLQLPYTSRKEWATKHGLPHFQKRAFQDANDIVCSRMGVSLPTSHGFSGQTLLDGCHKLGYPFDEAPQNVSASEHSCGHNCSYGCRSGAKQGGVQTWLRDAKEAGALFMTGVSVDRIILENGTARGAICTSNRGKFSIYADMVILSAGALHSPCILLRSGIKNSNIGKNLHLHPAATLYGFYDRETHPSDGAILTAVGHAASNRDGLGHGAFLETSIMDPSLYSVSFPWRGAAEYKRTMLQWNQAASFLSLCRDRDTGRVYNDPDTNQPRIAYDISAFDRQSILEGLLRSADVALVSGAKEIQSPQSSVPPFFPNMSEKARQESILDPSFVAWKEKIYYEGVVANRTIVASAHQMGSCKMGPSQRSSVVDSNGRVWGVQRLYVADASVFPSSSGVNPMVTTMAISYMIARGIVDSAMRARL